MRWGPFSIEGKISARELLEQYLDRIQSQNPAINALCTLDEERSFDNARMFENGTKAGPLAGLPIAIKDCFETKDIRTTHGSLVYRDTIPNLDALHVARLRAAGAIILGKSNTPEFCCGGQTTNAVFGTTRNPYNLDKTVAGSSGGAAAAVAASMVTLADGSDIAGSVRAPAGFCNTVGFRPSAGLIPIHPNRHPFERLNTPGPITKSVRDAAIMFDIMSGSDPKSPISSNLRRNTTINPAGSDDQPLRIAWAPSPAGAQTPRPIIERLQKSLPVLEDMGHRVVEDGPDFSAALRAQAVFLALAITADIGPIVADHPNLVQPHIQARESLIKQLSANDIIQAYTDRTTAWQTLLAFWEHYDYLVMPTNNLLAFDAEIPESDLEYGWETVQFQPVLGVPCISVPAGFTPDGMPCGLQIMGPYLDDLGVLALATAIEDATGYWKKGPNNL